MSEAARTDDTGDVLTFMVAGERLVLAAGDVAEIIRPRGMTRVPHGPDSLLGVTNLRGGVLPVVSLARLLDHAASPAELPPTARIVVMDKGARIGLLVDSVATLASRKDGQGRRIDLDALLARDFGALVRRAATRRDSPGVEARPAALRTVRNELAVIAFELSGQDYALPLDKVEEVTALPDGVAGIPRTDEAMMGVTAHRGGLLPLVSLRVLLGLPTAGFDPRRARILVTSIGTGAVGLVADGMKAILRVPLDAIDPVPPVLTRGSGEAQIEAICRLDGGRRLVSILSPARLFDSETARRILADAERGTAQMSDADARSAKIEQFIIFQLGDEQYGLPIASVDEVVRRPDSLARLPRAPAFVDGVMNLRGRVVPVIDQRQRFSYAGAESGRRRRVIVVTIEGLQAGFVVDSVSEVLGIPADELTVAPELGTDGGTPVFDRVAAIRRDGRMILLVDPKALLDQAERDMLAAITAEGSGKTGTGNRKAGKREARGAAGSS